MGVSHFLLGYWWAVLLAIAGGVAAFRWWVSRPSGRFVFDRFLLRIPVVGTALRRVAVARFARTLGTLAKSGIGILESLRVLRDTLGNEALARELDKVAAGITQGRSIAEPLRQTGQFPPLLIQVIAMGERTGRLDEMLLQTAEAYERETAAAIQRVMTVVPAVFIVLLALVVGFVLVAILLPIVNMETVHRAGYEEPLMRTRKSCRRRTGFTMVEIIVVVIIISILAALIVPKFIGRVGEAKRSTAMQQIAEIEKAVDLFQLRLRAIPDEPGRTGDPSQRHPRGELEGAHAQGQAPDRPVGPDVSVPRARRPRAGGHLQLRRRRAGRRRTVTTPTWSTGRPPPSPPPARAFTLVEMTVVMVLVAVLAGMTIPMLAGAAGSTRLKEQAHALLTAARYARDYAVTHRVDCRLAIDSDRRPVRPPAAGYRRHRRRDVRVHRPGLGPARGAAPATCGSAACRSARPTDAPRTRGSRSARPARPTPPWWRSPTGAGPTPCWWSRPAGGRP